MEKKVKLTREQWLTRNKDLPVALVLNPLKRIGQFMNGEEIHPIYKVAYRHARDGDGKTVQTIARTLTNSLYRSLKA